MSKALLIRAGADIEKRAHATCGSEHLVCGVGYARNKPQALVPAGRMAAVKISVIGLPARKARRPLRFTATGDVKILLVRIGVGGSEQIDDVSLRIIGLHLWPSMVRVQRHVGGRIEGAVFPVVKVRTVAAPARS